MTRVDPSNDQAELEAALCRAPTHGTTLRCPPEAVAHLKNRAQRVCDALGNHGRPQAWTLADVTAVRALIRELAATVPERT